MVTSEVVVLVVGIVKVERVYNTNNKVVIDVDNNSDGDGKDTLSWSISDLVVLLSRIILVLYSSGVVLSGRNVLMFVLIRWNRKLKQLQKQDRVTSQCYKPGSR